MKNKIKKILACIAMVPCAFLAAACGGNPPPENEDPYDESVVTPAQYTELSSKLKLVDVEDYAFKNEEHSVLYGKYGDIFEYGTGFAVYSNGVLYDYGASEYSDGEECIQWNIGKKLKIIQFDGDTLIVENSKGEMFAYQNILNESLDTPIRKLYSQKLNCNSDSYRFCYSSYGEFECFYKANGVVKIHVVNFLEQTEKLQDFYCQIYDYIDDSYEWKKVVDVCGENYNMYCLIENNIILESPYFGYQLDEETGRMYEDASSTYKFNNVSKIFDMVLGSDGVLVSVNGDNNKLYYHQSSDFSPVYENQELWYQEAVAIQIPTGYTVADIKRVISDGSSHSDAVLIEMKDGEYFICDDDDISSGESGDIVELHKVEGLKEICADSKVVRIYFDFGDMYLVMNDKNLYRFMVGSY